VLKFTRAGLRARWLRANFPESTIVLITREPRDIWTSAVGRGSARDDDVADPEQQWGAFLHYYETMATDVGLDVPGHPYRRFYALWLATQREVSLVADDAWHYEEIVGDYRRWAEVHLVGRRYSHSAPSVPIRRTSLGAEFHSDEWYDEEEADVRALLARSVTVGSGRPNSLG
jgi:hypothetical protein